MKVIGPEEGPCRPDDAGGNLQVAIYQYAVGKSDGRLIPGELPKGYVIGVMISERLLFPMSSWKEILAVIGGLISLLKLWEIFHLSVRAYLDRHTLNVRLGAELYDPDEINRATAFYVEPDFQSIDPSGAEDYRRLVCAREPLFSTTDRLLDHPGELKFVIVLADSGMGKTSFLLNYYSRHWRSRRRKKYALVLVNLSLPSADKLIAAIPFERQSSTVLFLDAFDEDQHAIEDYRRRLDAIIGMTAGYRAVLMTCRSQFFLKDDELPNRTGVMKIGSVRANESREYYFHKLYLAPFTDQQIDRYLRHRFRWKRKQRQQAFRFVKKVPDLVARPMLLAHIEDLVVTKQPFRHAFEVYDEMITAWLKREVGFVKDDQALGRFCEVLAMEIFVNREVRQMERIRGEELMPLAERYGIPLEAWQLRGRSLLNRDAAGNYKFAHRSIMEHLIVRTFTKGEMPSTAVPWTDLMKTFAIERLSCRSSRAGTPLILKNGDLSGTDLASIDLSNADLSGSNLSGCVLGGEALRGAKLQGTVLSDSDLRGAQLELADLSHANLERANLEGATLAKALLRGVSLQGANLDSVNLSGADLTGSDCSGQNFRFAEVEGANFSASCLREANFSDLRLSGAVFRDADMEGAIFAGVDFKGIDLTFARMSGSMLLRAKLGEADLRGAELRGADLRGADISLAYLDQCKGLTRDQIMMARGWQAARLPAAILWELPKVVLEQGFPTESPVGRNDPCPCGSGKKYKKCHGV